MNTSVLIGHPTGSSVGRKSPGLCWGSCMSDKGGDLSISTQIVSPDCGKAGVYSAPSLPRSPSSSWELGIISLSYRGPQLNIIATLSYQEWTWLSKENDPIQLANPEMRGNTSSVGLPEGFQAGQGNADRDTGADQPAFNPPLGAPALVKVTGLARAKGLP